MHSRDYVAIELELPVVDWADGEVSSFPVCKPFHLGIPIRNHFEAILSKSTNQATPRVTENLD